jgi:peptide chain release factor 1
VELQFGCGGADSKIFVDELFAAYCRYAQRLNLKSELLHSSSGHIIAKFYGVGVGKAFQHESGKHVLQRFPKNDTRGRKHTSIISVSLLPLPPERESVKIPEKELAIITQTGHGKGGQHQNHTQSAVRVSHKPTGINVFINGRDQHQNKKEALRIIEARVNEYYNRQIEENYNDKRKTQVSTNRGGDKIRTYNFTNSQILDHRTGKKTRNIKEFFKGNLEIIF